MRVVIVHNLEHAREALAVAVKCKKPIVLQSAPDAIFYAGALYLLKLFEQAQKEYPKADAIFILNCGDARAEAISAMQLGHKHIRSNAEPELREKLADIAAQLGVTVHSGPYETLDLGAVKDAKSACRAWLEKNSETR
jgi:hypothetical protein